MREQNPYEKQSNFKIAHGVYVGTLMSPTEVARATAGRDSPVYSALHRWTLCGDVSPTVFELVQAVQLGGPKANERVTAFSSKAGNGYVMFTHQIGTFQHRYFVPLFDARVNECLEQITRDGGLGYSLGGENNQAIVWRTVLGPRDFVPLKALCGTVTEGDEEAALEEYGRLLGEARDPARIPSVVEGVAVRYASVSAIPPNDLVTRLASRYGVRV